MDLIKLLSDTGLLHESLYILGLLVGITLFRGIIINIGSKSIKIGGKPHPIVLEKSTTEKMDNEG